MVTRPRGSASAAAVLALLALLGTPPAPAQAQQDEEERLDSVPAWLPAAVRDSLLRRRTAVELAIQAANREIEAFNGRCASFRADDVATRSWCETEYARLGSLRKRHEADKLVFNSSIRTAIEEAKNPKRPGIDRIHVPSPYVAKEEAARARNPAAWLAAAQQAVRAAARANRERTRALLQAIDELSPPDPKYELTKLSDLRPGDILLIAPTDPRSDAASAALGAGIQGADYLTRVASDLADGRIASAARQQAAGVSHALTFVKEVNGTMLFLDHAPGGTRMLDDRAFLLTYGAREMFVARPNEVVDGRALWNAASNAARQKKSDFGLTGTNVVCSERAGIAVARAAGFAPNTRRVLPVDITPGDFFDREGRTGKHFAVTRLRITPVN